MIKILLIEDELPAIKKLKRFINEIPTPIEVVAELSTVQSAVDFLTSHQPDLIISDIELLDGNAFEIFQQVSISCPIIFTTAYDQFWMDAFDSNGIGYLLKPFTLASFLKAWDKFLLLGKSTPTEEQTIEKIRKLLQEQPTEKPYKKRFSISTAKGFYFLETEDVLYFEADHGLVSAYDSRGKKHLLSITSLKEIEDHLNPMDFFRINRSELVHKAFIEKLERYNKNTLAIKLKGKDAFLKTSQSTTADFRAWLGK